VSGLAYGVDTIAHKTALENKGKTVAILGSGINNIFPPINRKLAQEIIKNGALISEYSLKAPALKQYFPWRNRIISGLCLATIVIEAPEKSGALITARFALEQNREIFAIPGSIFNRNSFGTHSLIKQGAKLVSQIEDILEELKLTD
jgi:DNA processing protein